MGLFSRAKKKRGGHDLARYAGMRMEAYDREGRMLFVAYAAVSRDGSMVLRPETAVRLRGNEKNVPARLRGFHSGLKKTVQLNCLLSARGDGSWSAERVEPAEGNSDRGYYRQETELAGEVVPMRQYGVDSVPCRIVNISAHGVGIRTEAEFRPGDRLLLTSRILKEWALTPLMCAVRRAVRRGKLYEYGCEFVDLTEQAESIITRAIMEMQARENAEE